MSMKPTYASAAIPYLMIRDAVNAIAFYKEAFGAEEIMRLPMPDGAIGHAEIRIEGAPVFLVDESVGVGMQSPQQLTATTVSITVYVDDVDTFTKKAEGAGAKIVRPLSDQFYGERSVGIQDPYGHNWHFSTMIEKLTVAQMLARMPKY